MNGDQMAAVAALISHVTGAPIVWQPSVGSHAAGSPRIGKTRITALSGRWACTGDEDASALCGLAALIASDAPVPAGHP